MKKYFVAIDRRVVGLGMCFTTALISVVIDSPQSRATEIVRSGTDDPVAIYTANCAACQGSDGKAKTAKGKRSGATDFTSDWNTDEDRAVKIITKGKGSMPSFKDKLTPPEIRAVLSHVLKFKQ